MTTDTSHLDSYHVGWPDRQCIITFTSDTFTTIVRHQLRDQIYYDEPIDPNQLFIKRRGFRCLTETPTHNQLSALKEAVKRSSAAAFRMGSAVSVSVGGRDYGISSTHSVILNIKG